MHDLSMYFVIQYYKVFGCPKVLFIFNRLLSYSLSNANMSAEIKVTLKEDTVEPHYKEVGYNKTLL